MFEMLSKPDLAVLHTANGHGLTCSRETPPPRQRSQSGPSCRRAWSPSCVWTRSRSSAAPPAARWGRRSGWTGSRGVASRRSGKSLEGSWRWDASVSGALFSFSRNSWGCPATDLPRAASPCKHTGSRHRSAAGTPWPRPSCGSAAGRDAHTCQSTPCWRTLCSGAQSSSSEGTPGLRGKTGTLGLSFSVLLSCFLLLVWRKGSLVWPFYHNLSIICSFNCCSNYNKSSSFAL